MRVLKKTVSNQLYIYCLCYTMFICLPCVTQHTLFVMAHRSSCIVYRTSLGFVICRCRKKH